MQATTIAAKGPVSYEVVLENGRRWKRNVDHFRRRPDDLPDISTKLPAEAWNYYNAEQTSGSAGDPVSGTLTLPDSTPASSGTDTEPTEAADPSTNSASSQNTVPEPRRSEADQTIYQCPAYQ